MFESIRDLFTKEEPVEHEWEKEFREEEERKARMMKRELEIHDNYRKGLK